MSKTYDRMLVDFINVYIYFLNRYSIKKEKKEKK